MSRFTAPFTSRELYLQSLSLMHNPVPSDKNVPQLPLPQFSSRPSPSWVLLLPARRANRNTDVVVWNVWTNCNSRESCWRIMTNLLLLPFITRCLLRKLNPRNVNKRTRKDCCHPSSDLRVIMKNAYILTRRVHKSMHFLKTGIHCTVFSVWTKWKKIAPASGITGWNRWNFTKGSTAQNKTEIEVNRLPINIHNGFVAIHS